ncbi:MAG: IPT/TIG domain-containing protein, partial [Planctomycetota bacterium]|nr:IPT/TIG domain-containing protein [Planctomycetota bacterium]
MFSRTILVLGCIVASLVSLPACGGGGGTTTPRAPIGVTEFSPGAGIPSEGDQPFLLSGWGFGMTGEVCRVRFTAKAGTPFAWGTSATLMAEGLIEHTGRVRGIIDPAEIPPLTGTVEATFELLLPDGTTHDAEGHAVTFAELVYELHITSVNPTVGGGGDLVTIVGMGFTHYDPGVPTVWFGPNAATGVTVVDDHKLTCVVPAGTGTVEVRVENTFATATATRTFHYFNDWSWDPDFGGIISSYCDDCSWLAPFDPGFSFPFYGTTYDGVYAAT